MVSIPRQVDGKDLEAKVLSIFQKFDSTIAPEFTDDLDLPTGTKIFVNQSLCPYYRILRSKTKRLQSMGKINSFFISG